MVMFGLVTQYVLYDPETDTSSPWFTDSTVPYQVHHVTVDGLNVTIYLTPVVGAEG